MTNYKRINELHAAQEHASLAGDKEEMARIGEELDKTVPAGYMDGILRDKGPWTPISDPDKNPGGYLLECFFARKRPDGTLLTEAELTTLGSGLIEAMTSENVIENLSEQRIEEE